MNNLEHIPESIVLDFSILLKGNLVGTPHLSPKVLPFKIRSSRDLHISRITFPCPSRGFLSVLFQLVTCMSGVYISMSLMGEWSSISSNTKSDAFEVFPFRSPRIIFMHLLFLQRDFSRLLSTFPLLFVYGEFIGGAYTNHIVNSSSSPKKFLI